MAVSRDPPILSAGRLTTLSPTSTRRCASSPGTSAPHGVGADDERSQQARRLDVGERAAEHPPAEPNPLKIMAMVGYCNPTRRCGNGGGGDCDWPADAAWEGTGCGRAGTSCGKSASCGRGCGVCELRAASWLLRKTRTTSLDTISRPQNKQMQETKFLKFLGFMCNPLPWVMEAAEIMAIALANGGGKPQDWQDFVGIITLLVINSTISFIEENNACRGCPHGSSCT